MNAKKHMALLDYLGCCVKCEYLSDLRALDPSRRASLRHMVEALTPDAAPLQEWNDAVEYITGGRPAERPEQARTTLLHWLAG